MIAVPKDESRPLLYLVVVGAVAAAAVAIFFGIGFLLLAPPYPASPSADPGLQAQALEAHEVVPPWANNDSAWGSSSAPAAEKVAANPTHGAPPNREAPELAATGIDTALIPPAGLTHTKRVRVGQHRHKLTGRHWGALWRSDARAGPLPGGGFYGPPNVNIGYINPNGAR
jgi:hypothetical protein